MEIGDTRGELLRLVAALRRHSDGGAPGPADPADIPSHARAIGRAARALAAESRTSSTEDRLRQRREELADLRQLRQWIEARLADLRSSNASLERLEAAIGRIEEKLNQWAEQPAHAPEKRSRPASDRVRSSVPSYAFSGRIQGQMVADMLQTVSSNGMSGVFVVEFEGEQTELYFDEGRMCHAKSGELVGEQAFFAAFGAQSGRYFFRETTELPEQKTIDASTQLLILEALRQIDESSRE